MTNRIALWLGVLIVAAFLMDRFAFDGSGALFLARKFVDLLHWVAFWR